jgi:CrcB protein
MGVYFAVALDGAAGATSRFGIDRAIERRSFAVFPWATFTINISGCLLIGVVVAALVDRHHAPAWLRTGLVVGFIGGYTTFSTFRAGGARPDAGGAIGGRTSVRVRERADRARRGVREDSRRSRAVAALTYRSLSI